MLRSRARLLPILACAACGPHDAAPPAGTDVLVVTTDTLRADELGC